MPTQDLVFVGYSSFKGKKDVNKIYYKLQFISIPVKTQDAKSAYYKQIDLFVSEEIYNDFVGYHELLETVAIPYVVIGDKVSFKLD